MLSPRNIFALSQLRMLAQSLMIACVCTGILHAQGGSPIQSEITGQPVPAGPSVNEFTGDFTYGLPILTVPGPNGSTYSMTLSYQAGTDPTADVSWVGYGWSLNPGAVIRGKRGFPDDWDGEVIYHAKRPADYTVSVEESVTAEIGSGDFITLPFLEKLSLVPGIQATQRYDSRTGFGSLFGLSAGVSFLGNYAGAQYMNDNGEASWSGVVSPNLLMTVSTLNGYYYNGRPEMKCAFWQTSEANVLRNILRSAGAPFVFASREFDMAPPAVVPVEGETRTFGLQTTISLSSGVIAGGSISLSANVMTVRPIPHQASHAYGYLRSVPAATNAAGLMDYYYEKDVSYTLDDKFLPIPFSNADVFSVTGGGTFRAYNRNPGLFQQNAVSSEIEIENEELTANIGLAWGAGLRWGTGSILYDARGWQNEEAPDYQSFTDEGDEPWFFRFSNDMGGSLLFDNNDDPVRAALVDDEGFFGDVIDLLRINDADRSPLLPSDIRLQQEAWERPGRSGYVGYTLNKDMLLQKNDKYYKAYDRDTMALNYWITDREEMPDQIGEFALYGTGGSRYIYGLPVYAKGEKTMSLGLRNVRLESPGSIKHNLLAYSYLDEANAPSAVGQEMREPYAAAWLLTAITTPSYVDLTGNGPTDDDLGGWTRFHYTRIRGDADKTSSSPAVWTQWRQPFNGLTFDQGELSDPEDDRGSYSMGCREQYYLSKVETPTHVAFFVLNDSWTPSLRRKDGYPQLFTTQVRELAGDSAASRAFYFDDMPVHNDMHFLDRIELYIKDTSGTADKLLSTVHFEYDYSLRPNMPNSLPIHPDSSTRHGMLTLRKVWTENLDVRNNRIAPVVFGYEYRKSGDYGANVQARYPEITSFADGLEADDENPAYSPYDFDAWGNYRPGGTERLDRRFPWVPQNDTSAWDPAALQLKWIKAPTGGEIQVQYEEDDYAFVHDRPAMAMVSLIEEPGEGFGEQSLDDGTNNKYFLRLSDIGVDSTDYQQVARVRELIERQMKSEKKLFFKFFYALDGSETDFEDPEYNSDYIEGYADLDTVILQQIDTGAAKWYTLYVRLRGYEEDGVTVHNHGLPKKVCWDFVKKNKRGKLGPDEGVAYDDWPTMAAETVFRFVGFDEGDHCQDIDYARSYIRIPMTAAKKGGGLRVKRLLSYDPGLEGDSTLYGTEYHYEVYDQERNEVISSGVAANEPTAIRDENALVAYMAREEDEKTIGKVMAGRDRARNEGPLGESLLPAASVGYSRVATNPIHQGATTVGFGVTDFHTYRDFPFDTRYETLGNAVGYTDMGGDDFRTSPLFQNFIFFRQIENLIYRTQGYRFILTDMHGQVRRRLSNGGAYTPFESDWITGAMTEQQYYRPGDSIPLLYRVGDSIRHGYPGKVMEVVQASRRNGSYIDDYKIEGDAGFWFLSGMAYYAVNNSELSTHVTTKVVQYPAIAKGMTTYADGTYNTVENVAFDPRSGQPLLTRSRDAFHNLALDQSPGGHIGTYHSYSFPVVNVHPEFDQAAGNEGALIASTDEFEIVKKKDGTGRPYLRFPAGNETRWLRKLTPGDLIELTVADDDDDAGRYHVDAISDTVVWLLPSGLYNITSDPSLSVVDEIVDLRVIRSGRANAPGAGIGSVTTYGETDAEAATGANFGWSGPGAAARLAFVDQLNDSLALGSGVFNETNVDSTLEFKLYTTGTCGTLDFLDESFALDTIGSMVLIASPDFTSPVRVDTIPHLGLGGWFALDDDGQIVFRSTGNLPSLHRWRAEPGGEQRVWNFTFCGDPVYRSVANVIAASASARMNDTVDYDGGGVTYVTNQPNAYEKGERGRWSPRTGYAYKTGITEGSRPVAGERTYKNAGVFDDFSLYNWHEPVSSDLTRWFRLDSITALDKESRPVRSVDMLGHSSLVRFGYGVDSALLPILSAWNADEGSVAFESFEPYDASSFDGDLTDQVAHSGRLSLTTDSNEFTIPLIATQQVLNKGWLVRFWMYPLWEDSVRIRLVTGGSPANYLVTGLHRVARAGEWALYEYQIDTATLNSYYSPGDSLELWFQKASSGDTIRIDDIKIQPADAVVAGYVYDRELFHSVAAFDDQNFGIYPQYDAEGKTIRTIIETSRGVKTVGESHIHVPGATRDWLGEGTPFTPGSILDGGLPASSIGTPTDPDRNVMQGAQFDLLNLQIGIDRQSMTLFGLEPSKLREFVQQKVGEFNTLTKDELMLLDRYEELDKRYTELQKLRGDMTTEEARAELDNELKRITVERDTLLKRLGIDTQ